MENMEELSVNIGKLSALYPQLVMQCMKDGGAGFMAEYDAALPWQQVLSEWTGRLLSDPMRVMEFQWRWWQDMSQLSYHMMQTLLGNRSHPIVTPDPRDRRFSDTLWQEHPLFHGLEQSYLITVRAVRETLLSQIPAHDQSGRQAVFAVNQVLNALSPSNFFFSNPTVLKETFATQGKNLVQGMENLLEDLKQGGGKLKIQMSDRHAFEVGKNLASTPGTVVYQNRLMQLIQYHPSTKEAHRRPLLVIPAWINKYYILDMRPENSLVRWLVDQGYSVFMVSWVNPDASHQDITFDDYLTLGPLAALEAIEKLTGEREVNAMGYCLGGTLLSILMAYLEAKGEADRIPSATLLTTMLDFSEPGDLGLFIDEPQIEALEKKMQEQGYLDAADMAMTFNLLRANELIWSFVVNNYMLGKTPFPFDLLYWNGDSTRMPPKMHSFYLRQMYLHNTLIKPNALTVAGQKIDLSRVTTPLYLLSTREDHIAPWRSTFMGARLFGSEDVEFTLAGSGHIAGVVSAPSRVKYPHWTGHYTHGMTPDEWQVKAVEEPGSWWPHWDAWQQKFTGGKVPARQITTANGNEAAPGSYVRVKG